jgi:hypothetical protein
MEWIGGVLGSLLIFFRRFGVKDLEFMVIMNTGKIFHHLE